MVLMKTIDANMYLPWHITFLGKFTMNIKKVFQSKGKYLYNTIWIAAHHPGSTEISMSIGKKKPVVLQTAGFLLHSY
jgi:hypothetical protein